MMIRTVLSFLCMAAVQAALLPIESSSSVNVKSDKSGESYSYSIHENRGVGLEHIILPQAVPLIKALPDHPLEDKPVEANTKVAHQEQQPLLKIETLPVYPYYLRGNEYYYIMPHQQLHYLPLK